MVRISAFSLAFVLGAATLAAQSPAPATAYVIPAFSGSSCPVSMRAEHRSGGSLVTTGGSTPDKIAQHIRLILDETGLASRVTAATVTVRGTNGKWRIVTASQAEAQPQPASPYISTTLNPVFLKNGDQTEFTDLDLPGFTSVKAIRLDSVTYADGSTWTPAEGKSCRVDPDPLMLVSSR